jgi:hypothetical protein
MLLSTVFILTVSLRTCDVCHHGCCVLQLELALKSVRWATVISWRKGSRKCQSDQKPKLLDSITSWVTERVDWFHLLLNPSKIQIGASSWSQNEIQTRFLKGIRHTKKCLFQFVYHSYWPPLCSSGQSSWLQIRRLGFDSRHYHKKISSGSGTGSTQPREYNWGATW